MQQSIRRAVAHFTSTPESELVAGVDGCSAPNYAVPLERLALGFARLAARDADAVYGSAPQVLADAMTAHPEMVSGEGRSDLQLMRAGRGDWVAKIGAEGVQGIGIRSAGIGIAIKIADGNRRALRPVIASVLEQLRLVDARCRAELADWFAPTVTQLPWNRHRTDPVVLCPGQIAVVFAVMRAPTATAPWEDELPYRGVVCRCKRAPQGAPDEAAIKVRGALGSRPDAAPAVRRAKLQMTQGLDG